MRILTGRLKTMAEVINRCFCAKFVKVLAIGEDVELAVKKGDKIIYSTDSSAKVEVPDGEIYFLPEKSILATIS